MKTLIEKIIDSLAQGDRTEVGGFGSFSVHYRKPRIGRNIKTGDSVSLPGKMQLILNQEKNYAIK